MAKLVAVLVLGLGLALFKKKKARLLKKARTVVQVFFWLPTATKATAIKTATTPGITAP